MAAIDKSACVEATGQLTLRSALLKCIGELRLVGVSVDDLASRVYHAPADCRKIVISYPGINTAVRVSWVERPDNWTVRLARTELTSKGRVPKTFLKKS